MTPEYIIQELQTLGNTQFKDNLKRYGITNDTALGIRIPELRQFARKFKRNHELALQLWQTGIHEARLLAIFIADPNQVTEELMENWVKDFNSWDICDQACGNLFHKTHVAYQKALEWSNRVPEYEKRAAFALMASLTMHDKKAPNEKFRQFFPILEQEAYDNRNFVKKALNWALRQIGKRNYILNQEAICVAQSIKNQNTPAANWVATNALRELTNLELQQKLKNKA